MTSAKPSLDLLRRLTDEHVLRVLMAHRRLTRAEVAALTGISKPTISEAVRRLAASGLVVDTGERSSGRGRAGTYFSLSPATGLALVAEAVDAFGVVVASAEEGLAPGAGPGAVAEALTGAVARLGVHGLVTAVVSAADPVDRWTGRLVHLPDAPFLIGDLDARALLADLVTGPVVEVHISNVHRREAFRHHSYLSDVVTGVIVGLGTQGYELAIAAIAAQVGDVPDRRPGLSS